MTISEIQAALDARLYTGEDLLPYNIDAACGCDLMSDVLAFGKENMVLMTGLINQHSIRTADMLDCRCIVFVRGKSPTPDMIEMAQDRGIALMATGYSLYTACGLLYQCGLPGGPKEPQP